MTSLIAWIGADQRGPASLNIATDSRITWNPDVAPRDYWDQAKKVFVSRTEPLVIGFVGDVLFPMLAVPAVIDRIEHGVYPGGERIVEGVTQGIRHLWSEYPAGQRGGVTIYIATRHGSGMTAKFELASLVYSKRSKEWVTVNYSIPLTSSLVVVDGSGRASVSSSLQSWEASSVGGTSRAVFAGFVDAIVSGKDPYSGGSPQIGSLFRVGGGNLLGIVHQGQRYFAGAHLIGDEVVEGVDWRNELFERADGRSKKRLPGAQPQPRPVDLGS